MSFFIFLLPSTTHTVSQTHILRLIKEVGYELSFLLLRRQSPTEKCLTPGLRPEKVQDKYFLVPDNKGGA